MSYVAAIDQLYALGQELASVDPAAPRRKFDLAHMRRLAVALGDPQKSFPSILIAGTNGKGSTAATLAAILASAGYRTGLYTSPHLIRVNERFQFSAPVLPSEYASAEFPPSAGPSALMPISDEDFARHYFNVDSAARGLVDSGALPHFPSFFEVLTGLAFAYFAERRADVVVLEVGLGGRLDATNIVDPILSVITDVALDHQDYLGSTLAEIAREKAGILRAGGTLVTLPQHPDTNRVFGEVAQELQGLRAVSAASFMPSPMDLVPIPLNSTNENSLLRSSGEEDGAETDPKLLPSTFYRVNVEEESVLVASPLRGQHQQRNIALALAAAVELRNHKSYRIANEAMEAGIRETYWPGRLQEVSLSNATLLLDVAHNPAGAWALRSALAALPSSLPRTLVFSCLRDKKLAEMTQILFPLFDSASADLDRSRDHIVLAPIDNPRAAAVDDLLAAAHALDIPAHAAPHLAAAFAQAREVTPTGGLIVATGSVYLVGEVLRLVQEHA
ncbi:MAG: folylpolyglutamate synthase/dihydrofolate synthase family protein [Acidobacteriaceae bacterium]